MKKLVAFLLTVAMSLACFNLIGCNSGSTTGTTVKVGLICLHGETSTYDKNFIDAFKAACAAKGLKEGEYKIITDIAEDETCYTEAANLADAGAKAVFADSFGHEAHMLRAAKEFPNVQFCHATGNTAHTENVANFHNAFASIYEGRYLAGVAGGLKLKELIDAGKLTDKNYNGENIKIGYVGAYPYEEVKSGYTSYYLGVKSIVPNVEMTVKFTNQWYDQTKENNMANALITEGCALISQHADSMGAPNACETAGVPNVSYNGSTASQCPNTFIISSRINWQPYFELMIESAVNGNGEIPTNYTGSLADGSVAITELGNAAAEGTQEVLEEVKAKFLAGTLKVFDLSTFTENGSPLADDYKANVDTDAKFEPETVVIKTVEIDGKTVKYFAESEFRSAPYFAVDIDGIIIDTTTL